MLNKSKVQTGVMLLISN